MSFVSGGEIVRAGFCLRRNSDSRDYKVLMNVAGDSRDFAIVPAELRAVARRLATAMTDASGAEDVVGLAPGGIPIAVGLAYELEAPAVIAYKCRLDLPREITWTEPHATNNRFYLYGLEPGTRVVVIDDEVDSGHTLTNAVRSLSAHGIDVLEVGAVVETLHRARSFGRERLWGAGVVLTALYQLDMSA
jgi:adenine phosphoribosyltransferase